MAIDPPKDLRMARRGTNQTGMRQGNERLVLTLLRAQKTLSKAQIARQTGLSAQTVSVIMRALEADGLLQRGAPERGRVGQPSVPMSLAADGAYFLGLKIGRRSSELVLVDFHGRILGRRIQRHQWPTPSASVTFAKAAAATLIALLPPDKQSRVAGLGIAMPSRMWEWAAHIGAPLDEITAWRDCDLRAALDASFPFPVLQENDATAACGAELVFGTTPLPADFVYFYVGFFIGGGIVFQNALVSGRAGNAGALGSMPVRSQAGQSAQLIDIASAAVLERAVIANGLSGDALWSDATDWDIPLPILDPWIDSAADAIAQACVASQCILEFDAAVIDGWMPEGVRRRLVSRTQAALRSLTVTGINPPQVLEGSLGPDARALGAAALTLLDRFLIGPNAAALTIDP